MVKLIVLNDRANLEKVLKDGTGQSIMKYKCDICRSIRYAKYIKGKKVWTNCRCFLRRVLLPKRLKHTKTEKEYKKEKIC